MQNKKTLKSVLNEAAFENFNGPDSYDPGDDFGGDTQSDLYDPDFLDGAGGNSATALKSARPGKKMQVNLSVTNSTASKITVELFSALDSWLTQKKAELSIANYTMTPYLSLEGIAALIAAPTGGNCVGINQSGNLEVRGNAGDPKLIVGCGEYPYNSLLESTKTLPFNVSAVRYTVTTDLQIDENITHFTRTFAGGQNQNTISPRAYFKPNQYQNKTLDILAPFNIDSESGLRIPVLAGESIRLALFIQRWARPVV